MVIPAERTFFDELLPTGNSLVKKCPLMTSLERKYLCLHTCEGLVLYYYLNVLYIKMMRNIGQEKRDGRFLIMEVGFLKI